jgi:hypothetical protein
MERFSRDEIEVMLRAEREYGAAAMSEWLAEALVEAGVIPRALPLAGGLSAGRHALTLEITDGQRVASDTMTATIRAAPALVARGD